MEDDASQGWETLNLPEGVTDKGEYRYTYGTGPNGPAFITKEDLNKKVIKDDPLGQQRAACIDLVVPYFPEEYMMPLFESEEMTDEKSSLLTDIDSCIKNFTAQSVLSGIDDAGWQEHPARLKKLNVDKYVDLMQDTYDRQKSQS